MKPERHSEPLRPKPDTLFTISVNATPSLRFDPGTRFEERFVSRRVNPSD